MIAFDNFCHNFVQLELLETEMNTLPSSHKQRHFNLTTSPLKRPTAYCNQSINMRLFQT